MDQSKTAFDRLFMDHPASVDETYWQHFCFALRFSRRLFMAACAAFLHALIPAACETTASRTIRAMVSEMEQRDRRTQDQS